MTNWYTQVSAICYQFHLFVKQHRPYTCKMASFTFMFGHCKLAATATAAVVINSSKHIRLHTVNPQLIYKMKTVQVSSMATPTLG